MFFRQSSLLMEIQIQLRKIVVDRPIDKEGEALPLISSLAYSGKVVGSKLAEQKQVYN